MKGREIQRRYLEETRRYFKRILGLYRQFKKKYYLIKERHHQKNNENKELTSEKSNNDLDNNQKKNEKDAYVEMNEKNN